MNADQIYDRLSERAKRFVSREAVVEVLAAVQELWRLSECKRNAAMIAAALPSDAAQAPLTDEHILKAFRDAGIRFQYVGARDTVATQITCGSQNAHLMVSAVRALLAANAE